MITLWTIQEENALKQIEKHGKLTTNGFRGFADWQIAYDWMRNEMIQKIGKPQSRKQYPIWAWYQYMDVNHKKPDLRRTGHLPSGTKGVRIKFRKQFNEVLLSDFDLWHYPLSFKSYIPNCEEDDKQFDKYLSKEKHHNTDFDKLPKSVCNRIEKSWQKIFDINFQNEYISKPMNQKSLQATTWQILNEEIVTIETFTAK